MIGHHVDYCKKWHPEPEARQDTVEKPPKKVYAQKRDGRQDQVKTNEAIDVEKEVVNLDEQQIAGQKINEDELARKKYAEKGKAPERLSPEELLRLKDNQLHNELNELTDKVTNEKNVESCEDDETVSQGSFVVDSQRHDSPVEANEQEEEHADHTPVRVMDMDFLKKSWNHMIEIEVEEEDISADAAKSTNVLAQNIVDKDDFQTVLPKNRKKLQKKTIQTTKGTYTTRSKVPQKPFK